MEINKILHSIYLRGDISKQAYRTYKGQIKAGDKKGCLTGMLRKKLINKEVFDKLL